MLTKAQRVSRKKDNVTYCYPSKGYDSSSAIQIDLEHYEEVDTIQGELPESDETFPKGAPMENYAKVGEKILKKKIR
ncbi:hypothetical protein GCM10027046_10290 [Uliginosibacterium flavum]|uniref:Transposase n=1 Tax=Uliginosibacterium flavum TaxID=1396831 RepID=A0ABV2TPZ2_9RHOO